MFENSPQLPNNLPPPSVLSEKNESVGSRLPEELLDEVMKSGPSKGKITVIIILSLIVLAGIALGGYFLYKRFFAGEEEIINNTNISLNTNQTIISPAEKQILAVCYLQVNPAALSYIPDGKIFDDYQTRASQAMDCNYKEADLNGVLSLLQTDQDGDGLNLIVEDKYGTSDDMKDTDADGYDDLTEINNGYNPKGSGKL